MASRLSLSFVFETIKMYSTLFNVNFAEMFLPKFEHKEEVDNTSEHEKKEYQFSTKL
jgi:hypothetical protein